MVQQITNEFIHKLKLHWKSKKFLCVGLDPNYSKLSGSLLSQTSSVEQAFVNFNCDIIDAVASYVCAFKPNIAFYEAYGVEGWNSLVKTIRYIQFKYKNIPIILDAKRGDIANTNKEYAKAYFDDLRVDGLTVHPYMGKDSLMPFLEYKEKGVLVLLKTSNPGADELQDLIIRKENKRLFEVIAQKITHEWNMHGNCGVVVGATYAKDLSVVRKIVKDMPILIPGTGAQGGKLEQTIASSLTQSKDGIIVNASRSILYSSSDTNYIVAASTEANRIDSAIRNIVNSVND